MNKYGLKILIYLLGIVSWHSVKADDNHSAALKRAKYLLTGIFPTDEEFSRDTTSSSYRAAVRSYFDHPNFYHQILRYHEKLFGTGLPTDYLEELMRDDIDNKLNKLARIRCDKVNFTNSQQELACHWASSVEDRNSGQASCANSELIGTSVFWYPEVIAWVCPTVLQNCGTDLSRCFIEYADFNQARNAELGTTEIFDSRFAVVKSLSKQAAGIATAIAIENYPYHNILKPGVTAVDGAIAHFYRQHNHFDMNKLNLSSSFMELVNSVALTDTRFRLVNSGNSYEHAGVLSTFAWLRRYEKHRSRANQLYERLLCQKFTSELPKVFPQDPGNLRETPGCSGCHATLDPLADFFSAWGEGGELYSGQQSSIATTFNGQSGTYLADLANIIINDDAFATCTVENLWKWLIGRPFYRDEAELRRGLTSYFVSTNYSLREAIYALVTHPVFVTEVRESASVGDPLSAPPLGEPPGGIEDLSCDTEIDFVTDIQPSLNLCSSCHNSTSNSRQDLTTEEQWQTWGAQSVSMISSGNMPPGQAGPPKIGSLYEFKEKVRCWLEQN